MWVQAPPRFPFHSRSFAEWHTPTREGLHDLPPGWTIYDPTQQSTNMPFIIIALILVVAMLGYYIYLDGKHDNRWDDENDWD